MSFTVDRNVLKKGWKRFAIMHRDRHIASIREDGSCTVYYPSFMPYNLYLEESDDLDTRLNNLGNFFYWCASRTLTPGRKYAKEILNSIGASQAVTDRERAAVSVSYHALSLNDVFWVRADREQLHYSDINLYSHSLSGAFTNVSLRGKQLTAQNAEMLTAGDAAGDVSTSGVAPKAWVRENGRFFLLKDGEERDVEAELLASRVARCFDVKQVFYEEAAFDSIRVSRCEMFTTEAQSIVPIEYVDIYCANHEMDSMELVLRKDSYTYYMMNVVDYLVGNTDRHWGNWGFLTDNRTNRLTELYPLMDLNKAFLSYTTVDGAMCLTVKERLSQKEAAIRAVKCVGLNQIAEIREAWFKDPAIRDMFFARLQILKNAI